MKSKIIVISPYYSPMKNGLGQYSTKFYEAIKAQGMQSRVITESNPDIIAKNSGSSDILPIVTKWKLKNMISAYKDGNFNAEDYILLQYVPFMYSKRGGINFALIFFIIYLRFIKGHKVGVMFHELHYPLHTHWKAIIMYIAHHIILFFMGMSATDVFCSTEDFTRYTKQFLLGIKQNVYHLPVFSNIEIKNYSEEELNSLKNKYGIQGKKCVGLFGSFHESKNISMILKTLLNMNDKYKIVYVGATHEQLVNELGEEWRQKIEESLIAPGVLSNEDVSKHMQIFDVMISYFADGVSTRRGSVMAALLHGVPVITTSTERTDKIFYNNDLVELLSSDEYLFKKTLPSALDKVVNSEKSNIAIKNFYNDNFSITHILNKFVSLSGAGQK